MTPEETVAKVIEALRVKLIQTLMNFPDQVVIDGKRLADTIAPSLAHHDPPVVIAATLLLFGGAAEVWQEGLGKKN